MKYMLICVAERDIEEPEFFDTLEEAHTAMCEQLADVYGVPVEDIKESYLSGEEYDGQTCVNENSAWVSVTGITSIGKFLRLVYE